jgi:hypothetical protein
MALYDTCRELEELLREANYQYQKFDIDVEGEKGANFLVDTSRCGYDALISSLSSIGKVSDQDGEADFKFKRQSFLIRDSGGATHIEPC